MSDLQDLIHRNAQLAFEQGVKTERERIVKLLEVEADNFDEMCWPMAGSPLRAMAQTLKGEQK